jgi:hypothetical protein
MSVLLVIIMRARVHPPCFLERRQAFAVIHTNIHMALEQLYKPGNPACRARCNGVLLLLSRELTSRCAEGAERHSLALLAMPQ